MRAAILTISTSKALGLGHDESGERMAQVLEELGAEPAGRELVGDEQSAIEARLRHWADIERCRLVLTSGGTGLSPTDVTPEATRAVIEREVPGLSLAMLEASRAHTPHWMLSRAVAGVRGTCLIVNLPGSPNGVTQCAAAIAGALPHALALIAGEPITH